MNVPGPRARVRSPANLLAWMKSLHLVAFALAMPLGPQTSRVLGLGPWEHGAVSAAYPMAACASGFAALFVTDRFAGRRSLIAVFGALGISLLATATADNLHELLVCRLVSGICGGLLCAWLPISLTRATVPAERRSALKGALAWWPSVALALLLPVALFAGAVWDWHACYTLLGILVLMTFPLLSALPALRHPAFERHASERQLTILLHTPRNRVALAVSALFAASSSLVVTFFSGLLVVNAGFTERDLPVFFLVGGTLAVVASPTFERLANGARPFATLVVIAAVTASVYTALASLGPVGWTVALPLATLFMLTNAARFAPASVLVNLHLKPRYTARYLGLSAVVQQGAAAVGFLIAGLIITHPAGGPLLGFPVVSALACALLVVAVGLASGLARRSKTARTAVPLIREAAAD